MDTFSVDSFDDVSIYFSSQGDLVKAIDLVYSEKDFIVQANIKFNKEIDPKERTEVFSELIISANILAKVKNGEFKLASVEVLK